MGDRFYRQQCEHFKIKPGELMVANRFPGLPESQKLFAKLLGETNSRGRRSKQEVVAQVCDTLFVRPFPGLDKLTFVSLDELMACTPNMEVELPMPTGRAKAPYVNALETLLPCKADFSKLTVATIKQFLSRLGVE